MKYKFTFLLLCALIVKSTNLFGQLSDCDGARYINDVFTEVQRTTVQYGQNTNVLGQSQDLMMDIYTPVGDDPNIQRPVMVMAHGGSFIYGDRSLEEGRCKDLARKGFVTASIDYRLYNILLGLPDSLDMLEVVVMAVSDMKAAVRYFKADADGSNLHNINPNLIFVGGVSAGAVTATHTAYLQMDDENVPGFVSSIVAEQGGIEGTSGNPGYSSEVAGVWNLSGGLYNPEWITADEAPLMSYHGTADGTVYYDYGLAAGIMGLYGSNPVHIHAEMVGLPNFLYTVQGGGHTDIYEGGAMDGEWPAFLGESATFFEEIICSAVSNNEIAKTAVSINIHPNPASEYAHIVIGNADQPYNLSIYDQLGRKVYAAYGNTSGQIDLDKNELGNGLFVVNIMLNNGAQFTEQLIFR